MTTFDRFDYLCRLISPTPDERYERDLYAVQNPAAWIKYPILPMIRLSDGEAGIIIAQPKPIVYLTNMYLLGTGRLGDLLKDVPTVEYATFEQLVTDWRGD